MKNNLKEVRFDKYCKTCKYEYYPEDRHPCYICLNRPVNVYSHKPIKWKDKNKF